MPEQAAGVKHVLVPEDLWLFLYEDSNKLEPEDASATFPSGAEACGICSVELNKLASSKDTLRAIKNKERRNHDKLLTGKSTALQPGCMYYLLPSSWLTKWRNYVTANPKSASQPVRPDPLEGIIDALTCVKTDGLTIISENDWKFFREDWQCANSNCVSAEIEFSSGDVKKLVGSCEEMPISDENLNPPNDGANDEVESRQPA